MEYSLGLRQPSGRAAVIGTAVHKLFELLAKAKIDCPSLKTDEIRPYSAKELMAVEGCKCDITNEIYDYYVRDNPHIDFVRADLTKYNRIIRKGLELFDPRNENVYAVEEVFDLTLPNGVRLRGTTDLITVEDGVYHVVDYKTGMTKDFATGKERSYDDFAQDAQLLIYFYAFAKVLQTTDIVITIVFLDRKVEFSLCFPESHVDMLEEKLIMLSEKIMACESPTLTESWRCRKFCHFGKTKFDEGDSCSMCYTTYRKMQRDGLAVVAEEMSEEVTYDRG